MEQAMCVAGLKQRTYATIFKAKISNSRTATQQMWVCASFSLSYVAYSKCVYRYYGARTTLNWLLLLYCMPFCSLFFSLFISACVLLAPFLFFLFFTIFFFFIFSFSVSLRLCLDTILWQILCTAENVYVCIDFFVLYFHTKSLKRNETAYTNPKRPKKRAKCINKKVKQQRQQQQTTKKE